MFLPDRRAAESRNAQGSGFRGTGNGQWPLLRIAGIAGIAIVVGTLTAMVAGRVGPRALYYAAVFGLLGAATLVAVTRDEPLRLAWFALLCAFPFANVLVPPGRLGFKVFDVVMIAIAAALVLRHVVAIRVASRTPLFPGRSLAAAWLLGLPCALFSLYPVLSLLILAVNAGTYAFFLMGLDETRRDGGFERLVTIVTCVALVIAGGVVVDHLFGVSLSLRGTNLNRISYAGGMQIHRASGFFNDPQTAGAFLSCLTTFLLLLLIRGRFSAGVLRWSIVAAVVLSFYALLLTISRGAIIACVAMSALTLFAFNRWSAPVKLLSIGTLAIAVTGLLLVPGDELLRGLPPAIGERFRHLGENLDTRIMIWFDTWEMFADNPWTGVGMGAFRPYLLETRPGVVNYYGIGLGEGVPYVPGQPENGYLKILYEGGIAGALAALAIAGDAVRRALRVIRRQAVDSHARTECIAALAALLTFAVTFTTLFTWTDSRVSGLFALLLAVIWRRSLDTEGPAAGRRA